MDGVTNEIREIDAKTKTCPILQPAGKCIASDCMGWRWNIFVRTDGVVISTDEGYCGMFNRI